jgi:hypothetical protein
VAQQVKAAWANVKTYQLTGQTSITKSGARYIALSWDTQSDIDLAANKQHQTLTGDVTGTGVQSKVESYLVDSYEYQRPGEGTSWFKYRASSDAFQRRNLIGRQVDLLTGATKIELAGVQQVNGVSCQQLRIVPDAYKLLTFAQVGQAGNQPQPGEEPPPVELRSVDVTLCVALDTRLPVKTEMRFVAVSEGVTNQVDMVLTILNVNKPSNIQLPPDAANAIEFPVPPSS